MSSGDRPAGSENTTRTRPLPASSTLSACGVRPSAATSFADSQAESSSSEMADFWSRWSDHCLA